MSRLNSMIATLNFSFHIQLLIIKRSSGNTTALLLVTCRKCLETVIVLFKTIAVL